MSVDKLVDSTQLDADLTSVANAIRAKSGGSGQLAFPTDFVGEIGNIPSGETLYFLPNGFGLYTENMETPLSNTYGWAAGAYQNAIHLKSFVAKKAPASAYQYKDTFNGCTNLETCILERASGTPNGGNVTTWKNCKKLREVQLGSVGYAIASLAAVTNLFANCTQADLTITIYVNASDLASVPTNVSTKMPQGATNATIIYRSSTTGEVLV